LKNGFFVSLRCIAIPQGCPVEKEEERKKKL